MTVMRDLRSVGRHRVESLTPEPVVAVERQKSSIELESERQGKRRKIKEQIATRTIAERRHQDALVAIEVAKRMLDRTADEHVIACEPIQSRLDEIEVASRESLLSRQPLDDALEAERRELLNQLRGLNEGLDDAVDEHNERIRELNKERVQAAKSVPIMGPNTNDLYTLGRPDLVAKCELAKHTHTYASKRLELLRNELLNTPTDAINHAEFEVAKTKLEWDAAFQEVINE